MARVLISFLLIWLWFTILSLLCSLFWNMPKKEGKKYFAKCVAFGSITAIITTIVLVIIVTLF